MVEMSSDMRPENSLSGEATCGCSTMRQRETCAAEEKLGFNGERSSDPIQVSKSRSTGRWRHKSDLPRD